RMPPRPSPRPWPHAGRSSMGRPPRGGPRVADPLHTPLCDLLQIRYPVLQAGMGMIARGPLAAAVSAAGGLGVIGATHLEPDELRREIRFVREHTDRPFGVDVLFAAGADRDAEAAARYDAEVRAHLEIVFEERVPVLVAGLGSPEGAVERAHARGMRVLAAVGNVKQARRVAAAGVDAVIAQGHEAGGHTGRIGSRVLVPAGV